MINSSDVIVIGAGVVGCSVAYFLSRSGAKVTLLEREAIGSGASAHATGSLTLLGAEFDPGPSFQLALAGYHEFPPLVESLQEETGLDLLFQRRPSLRLALEEEEESMIKSMMPWQREAVDLRWIEADEVHEVQPGLTNQVRGAVFQSESAQLDSYRLNLALAQAFEKRGGQLLLREVTGLQTRQTRVIGVTTSSGDLSADMVVVAAGTWSATFSRWLHFTVPVRPLKGERLLLRYPGPPLQVLISSPKRGHMISRLDGMLSVGSTGGRDYDREDLFLGEEFDRQPTERAKAELLQRAVDVFPDLQRAELVQQLAGSRPLSPDRMPIIGPVPGWQGIMLATGHTTKGIHLGPITGKLIAGTITKGSPQTDLDLSGFLPDRFANLRDTDFYASGQRVDE